MDPATGVPNFVNCASGDRSFTLGNYEPDVCGCVYVCVMTAPYLSACRSPDTHSIADALLSASSTRESEPWYQLMSSKRLWLAATTGTSTIVSERTDTMLYSTCVLEHRCRLLTMQCDCHDGHALTAYRRRAAGVQGQSHVSQEMLAVRGCHATAVSLVM